jgi:RHS repeat-associated protein
MVLFFQRAALSYLLNHPYSGKELDEETGLLYFGARYLNPQTSMWLFADPAMGEFIIPSICMYLRMQGITQ